MKSPKAKRQVLTFTYPAPLDEKGEDRIDRSSMIDPEVLEDKENLPWVTVRIPRSKADIDAVADYSASVVLLGDNGDSGSFKQRIKQGNAGIFELLVEGWSFEQTDAMKPNASEFSQLDVWAADWISACVGECVSQGTTRDYAKKTNPSSPPQDKSPSESPLEQPVVSE